MKYLICTTLVLCSYTIACAKCCCGPCCGPRGCQPSCCMPYTPPQQQPLAPAPTIKPATEQVKEQPQNPELKQEQTKEVETQQVKKQEVDAQEIKDTVKESYSQVAEEECSCCPGGGCCGGGADLSQTIGYSKEELDKFAEANLGLGCGNPISLGNIKEGFVVLDLGSGPGLDCFLASKKVGSTGKVIGVDMTPAMIKKAQENAQKYEIENVEFRLGDIENLPVEDNLIDIVISNCVINLTPNKSRVFEEVYRVLKPNGKMYVSDVVLLGKLTEEQRNDKKLLCACVSGAILKDDYIAKLVAVGFTVNVVEEDREIAQKWFNNNELPIASLKYIASK